MEVHANDKIKNFTPTTYSEELIFLNVLIYWHTGFDLK